MPYICYFYLCWAIISKSFCILCSLKFKECLFEGFQDLGGNCGELCGVLAAAADVRVALLPGAGGARGAGVACAALSLRRRLLRVPLPCVRKQLPQPAPLLLHEQKLQGKQPAPPPPMSSLVVFRMTCASGSGRAFCAGARRRRAPPRCAAAAAHLGPAPPPSTVCQILHLWQWTKIIAIDFSSLCATQHNKLLSITHINTFRKNKV